jgi:choline dehydrogenase-like flavoprotein
LKNENSIKKVFPHYQTTRTSDDLAIFTGLTEGGSTSISCGNMVRAERGLKEIGLDLSPEYEEIERSIPINPIPRERWRPLTQRMFDEAQKLGFSPKPTPKVDDLKKCVGCGFCELGCATGAKWDSRLLYRDYLGKGIAIETGSKVENVIVESGHSKAVLVSDGKSTRRVDADIVVLAAGGVGTAQILKASNLPARDSLWVDIV